MRQATEWVSTISSILQMRELRHRRLVNSARISQLEEAVKFWIQLDEYQRPCYPTSSWFLRSLYSKVGYDCESGKRANVGETICSLYCLIITAFNL